MPIDISIIIPVYNTGKSVGKCISSIKQQTFQNYEVILIDDGSSDNSASVIKESIAGDNRFQYYYQPNGGVSSSRNRGLELATGEYIIFIDSDDFIASTYLENIFIQVIKHPADLYVWGVTYVFDNNKQKVVAPNFTGSFDKHSFISFFVKEQYGNTDGIYGYIANKLIKRIIVDKHQLRFNVGQTLMEDYAFYLNYYNYIQNAFCFDESGYFYVKVSDANRPQRKINYLSLIDVHHQCQLLMADNAISDDNVNSVIKKYIGNLVVALFLEMAPVVYNSICNELDTLFEKEYPICALKESNYGRKALRSLILKRQSTMIYLYLWVWDKYLKIRGVR